MYAPSISKLVAELEVSPSNRVTKASDQYVEPLRVTKAVVSPSGEWMATIDQREGDESFRPEVYMKLWQWDAQTNMWSLHTRIDRPHGSESVTTVLFSPHKAGNNDIQLATVGRSKFIKTWRIQRRRDENGKFEF
jgi:NET1-associated nuclear protein 1 (U3 small nucleolar RNA-associated protein 17)